MLENLERIERPDEIIKPQFKFRHSSGATKQILSLDSAEVGYDGSAVLPPLTLKVARGEKIVFKGFNGIGKDDSAQNNSRRPSACKRKHGVRGKHRIGLSAAGGGL
jgi:ATPase subunit of ABC transporter with duplicated ATPase domains